MATESKKVRRDAFVRSVRPDPKSTEDLVLLQGYIGDSDLAGHIRVYSDPVLSDFIELPEQDILYCDPVEATEDPLGGSRLWVKKTTVFTAGEPGFVNRAKSSFLEGDILKAFGDTGKIPTVVAGGIQAFSAGISCPPTKCDPQPPRQTNQLMVCFTGNDPVCAFHPGDTIPPQTRRRSCLMLCNFTRNNVTCQVHPGDTIPPIPQTRFRSCVALCLSQNNVTCQVDPGFNQAVQQQQQFGAAAPGYAGGFDPYETGNYGY
ncbi:MAG: hypothetical protein ACKVUS_16900 [Saprospiraceae bacterium]